MFRVYSKAHHCRLCGIAYQVRKIGNSWLKGDRTNLGTQWYSYLWIQNWIVDTGTLEMWLLPSNNWKCDCYLLTSSNNNQHLRGLKFWPRPISSCVQSLCWESNCRHWMLSHGPQSAVNADSGTKRMDKNQEKTHVVNPTINPCQYHQKLVVYSGIQPP